MGPDQAGAQAVRTRARPSPRIARRRDAGAAHGEVFRAIRPVTAVAEVRAFVTWEVDAMLP